MKSPMENSGVIHYYNEMRPDYDVTTKSSKIGYEGVLEKGIHFDYKQTLDRNEEGYLYKWYKNSNSKWRTDFELEAKFVPG